MRFQQILEFCMLHPQHDIAVHLDEATVAVIGEACISACRSQAFHAFVVQAEVQHRVHHARHRNSRAGAHGDQQRVGPVAELGADRRLDMRHTGFYRPGELFRIRMTMLVVMGADFRRDRETRRHRQADARHLRQVGTLAPQQLTHPRIAFRRITAKNVNPLRHVGAIPRSD